MVTHRKFLIPVLALSAAALFFGPAGSTASADPGGPRVEFHGRIPLPHGGISVHVGDGPSYRHRSRDRHGRRYRNRSHYRHHRYERPYRLVRVLVYDPYPRWIYRRVDFPGRVGAPHHRRY